MHSHTSVWFLTHGNGRLKIVACLDGTSSLNSKQRGRERRNHDRVAKLFVEDSRRDANFETHETRNSIFGSAILIFRGSILVGSSHRSTIGNDHVRRNRRKMWREGKVGREREGEKIERTSSGKGLASGRYTLQSRSREWGYTIVGRSGSLENTSVRSRTSSVALLPPALPSISGRLVRFPFSLRPAR